jgi:hypothetical protein
VRQIKWLAAWAIHVRGSGLARHGSACMVLCAMLHQCGGSLTEAAIDLGLPQTGLLWFRAVCLIGAGAQ